MNDMEGCYKYKEILYRNLLMIYLKREVLRKNFHSEINDFFLNLYIMIRKK